MTNLLELAENDADVYIVPMGALPLIVAIDGGSGSGKSSSARALAAKLKCLHVDTGTHYRALTHLLQRAKIAWTDEEKIKKALSAMRAEAQVQSTHALILINGERVGEEALRSAAVNAEVSQYSTVAAVRAFLLPFQRSLANFALEKGFNGVVMEGRDIGLNIFPDTPYKYFLQADTKVKIQRREMQNIKDAIEMRDKIDSTLGQLKRAEGAATVDTTELPLEGVVAWILKDVKQKLAAGA